MDPDETLDDTRASESESEDLQEILSDPHARCLVAYLREQSGPVALSTAATHVAAGVTDTEPEAVPDEVRNRVQTFLHRGQLPELARHGVVEFDPERDTVALRR
ncbi:MAG: DUF7344 domain-containing protein [Halapricum sp.]